MAFDVLLDPDTGDLPRTPTIARVEEEDRLVVQAIDLRLSTWLGEWFLDVSEGIDWLGLRRRKPFPVEDARAAIQAAVLRAPRVTRVRGVTGQRVGQRVHFKIDVEIDNIPATVAVGVDPTADPTGTSMAHVLHFATSGGI